MEAYQHNINQLTPGIPCSYDGACHFTFHMAQMVSIPHNPLQPGPVYFLCPNKISIFGVMNDSKKKNNGTI